MNHPFPLCITFSKTLDILELLEKKLTEAIGYWIEKLINEIRSPRRFTNAFILEGLSMNLEFNYFQIKATALRTIFAIVGSHLTVVYLKERCLLSCPIFIPKT